VSYDLNLPATRKDQLEAALSGAVLQHEVGAEPSREADEHWAAIKDAVLALAAATGRPDDEVVVEVAGHANPGHAPLEGTANEVTYVVVRAVPPVVAVDRSEPAAPTT
jgi:hypothetical protein